MWPYRVVTTILSLVVASIDDIYLIYISVAVPVILREVGEVFRQTTCLSNHLCRMSIIIVLVLAIV